MNAKPIFILLLSLILLSACDNSSESSQNKSVSQKNNLQSKSSEEELKFKDSNFKNKEELIAAFNKMKDSWEIEFFILKEACGSIFPSVKNYGLFMTEEQILLSS